MGLVELTIYAALGVVELIIVRFVELIIVGFIELIIVPDVSIYKHTDHDGGAVNRCIHHVYICIAT